MRYSPKEEKAGYKNKWNKKTLGNKFLPVCGRDYFVCHNNIDLRIQYCYDFRLYQNFIVIFILMFTKDPD